MVAAKYNKKPEVEELIHWGADCSLKVTGSFDAGKVLSLSLSLSFFLSLSFSLSFSLSLFTSICLYIYLSKSKIVHMCLYYLLILGSGRGIGC